MEQAKVHQNCEDTQTVLVGNRFSSAGALSTDWQKYPKKDKSTDEVPAIAQKQQFRKFRRIVGELCQIQELLIGKAAVQDELLGCGAGTGTGTGAEEEERKRRKEKRCLVCLSKQMSEEAHSQSTAWKHIGGSQKGGASLRI